MGRAQGKRDPGGPNYLLKNSLAWEAFLELEHGAFSQKD